MSKVSRSFLPIIAGFLLLALPMAAAEAGRGSLVSVQWLEKHLNDANLVILDASPTPAYAAQHIPGAVGVDAMVYGVKDRPVDETERLFRKWGISRGKKIVIYDQGGSMMATRFFFTLYYHGVPAEQVAVLDGGLSKWQAEHLPVTKEVAKPKPGSFKIGKLNEDVRARLPEFLAASGDPAHNSLVEALDGGWHFGEVLAFDRAGHIPNGLMLPSADFYNADKTFKSPEEIGRMLAYLGVQREQQIYTYCGGGVAASVPFFALKFLLDYPRVKLFSESEMGWLSDERELPYWTYDAPHLLRDSKWLQSWGGEKFRMYGIAAVSIIDVRTPAEFSEGHTPFALNVPAGVFREKVSTPEKLPEILGPAGVDPTYEAVIVSRGGLTKESALAFVMLEKLGQKKVSILLDSMERWSQSGYGVKKEPTVVGPKKMPYDVSIPPAVYPVHVRDGVIVADPQSSRGIYPRVFIASGKELPANLPGGKVVHVPYTDLLDADGKPKAASDIWKILVKAGVPRYGELVCVSDDPGEAAANYFILKLMGFPDIKVLVTGAERTASSSRMCGEG